MSNSSLAASKKWDVFLSFSGEDTRTTFTGHLYSALVRNEICTFRDDDTLKRGRMIESELFKAIEESRIAVIVFSTNYAKSTWCLRELVKVMDCESRSQLTVLPVFYKVDPSDVRAQRNDFVIAFHRPEHKDMIPKCRMALEMAAGISGRALEAKGDEASFIEVVLKDISGILETFNTTMTNATHHVRQAKRSMPEAPPGINASGSTNATHHARQANGKGVSMPEAPGIKAAVSTNATHHGKGLEAQKAACKSKNLKSRYKFDVFLSFGGEESIKFADRLLAALVREGVSTFMSYKDDSQMERGKNIEFEVLKAVEESRMAVIIFSSYQYASSKWCLDELVKIMSCSRDSKLMVLPLFYRVHPADVRNQTNSYKLTEHKKHYTEDQMRGWRAALTEAASLQGLVLAEDCHWDRAAEPSFMEQVVQDIANKLAKPSATKKFVSETPESAPSNQVRTFTLQAPGIKAHGKGASTPALTNATHQGNGKGVEAQKAAGKSKNLKVQYKFDVFLSFGGTESIKFADRLLAALVGVGVSTFMSYKGDCQKERGKEIGFEVLKAVEESRMAVIIFSSRQYALSKWCLDELVKIMSCSRDSKLMVLPLFYYVHPADVRNQKSSYELTEHKKHYTEGQMRGWRAALTEAASLQGLVLDTYGDWAESSFMKQVVQDITYKLANPSAKNKFVSETLESAPSNPVGTFIHESAPFNPVGTFIHEKGYRGCEMGDQMSGWGTRQTNAAICPQLGCDDHLFWHEQVVHNITHSDGTTETIIQGNFSGNPSQSFGFPYFTPGFFGP